MTIFQVVSGKLLPFEPTTFSDAGLRERADLQQLLKQQIEVIAPDMLVIAEEFGEWDDSRRRIDLLALDKHAKLVVIELKRTEDGGHMELQALRYAAMVANLTFDKAVAEFQKYLTSQRKEGDAREEILEFLDWEEPDDDHFAQDVRIVLASAEFSLEITTCVLWLNEFGLDIRCVRMKPYKDSGRLLIDVQQVIPLPEAEQYQIQIREKKVVERTSRTQNRDLTRYDVTIGNEVFRNLPKRRAVYQVVRGLCNKGIDPDEIARLIPWKANALRSIEGKLDGVGFEKALGANLTDQGNRPDTHRYFIEDGELIQANGKTYALTKMWGLSTTKTIDTLLQHFPAHQISYQEAQ